jgi:hypothetical protein
VRFSKNDRERFEEKYIPEPNSGCWLWLAGLNHYGYGHFMMRSPKRMERAHRISYLMAGYKIPRGKKLLHSCDTRCCVNPDHLSPGTQLENMRQALARNRYCQGAAHHSSKFSESDIVEIRSSEELHTVLAGRYGVSVSTIGDIKRRRYWKHVP